MTERDAEARKRESSPLFDALALEGLIQANNESNETMMRLVESVHSETKARDRKVEVLAKNQEVLERNQRQLRMLSVFGVIAILCLLAMAVFNAYNTTASRRNAERATEIVAEVRATNRFLLDCINATGACGKANVANMNKAMNEIKRYELTGLYCARTNPQPVDPRGDKFLACMKRLYPTGPVLDRKDQ